MTSCLGELSAGNLYHCDTVGQWFLYDWLKIFSARGGGGERRDKKKGVHRIEPGSTDTYGYHP